METSSGMIRLHGQRLPPQLRSEIRNSTESARETARRCGVNLKTVLRWRQRDSSEPRRSRRARDQSALLAEVLAVSLRRFVRLSLDDCVHVLRTVSQAVSRASVHRCLRRHGISRLPEVRREYAPLGWFDLHVWPLGEHMHTHCLYVAVERRTRFIFAEVHPGARNGMADFLESMQKATPVTVRGVCLEQNGEITATFQRDLAIACADAAICCRSVVADWPDLKMFDMRECRPTGADSDSLGQKVRSLAQEFNTRCRLKAIGGLTPVACMARYQAAEAHDPSGRAETIGMRERILECARSLLSGVGPEGMSLSRVARMAGVNRGTIYHHFASRDELLGAATQWSSEQLTEAVFAAPFEVTEMQASESNVLRVIRRLANFAIRNPELSRAWLMQIISMPDPSKDRFWREYYGRSLRFQQTPVPAQDMDPEVLAVITLAGTFLWPMWARAKSGNGTDLQRDADRYVREFFRLMIHGSLRPEYAHDADAELQAMKQSYGREERGAAESPDRGKVSRACGVEDRR
jgi:AcrR family transcriptional regulator